MLEQATHDWPDEPDPDDDALTQGSSTVEVEGDPGIDHWKQVFIEHVGEIRAIVRFVGRRGRLSAQDAEEFESYVNLRLIEHGYAVLRKFEQRSSLRSYLAVVIQRLLLDWRIVQWGKWRPSAFASRNGRIAMLFEELTMCQGLSFEEARTTLETVHRLSVPRAELEALYSRFPVRQRRHFVGEDALTGVPASSPDPMAGLVADDEQVKATAIAAALAAALNTISPRDRRLLKLRFVDGLTVAAIARQTACDSKRLYRRLARLLGELRRSLSRRGLRAADVLSLFGRVDLTLTTNWESLYATVRESSDESCRPSPANVQAVLHEDTLVSDEDRVSA